MCGGAGVWSGISVLLKPEPDMVHGAAVQEAWTGTRSLHHALYGAGLTKLSCWLCSASFL